MNQNQSLDPEEQARLLMAEDKLKSITAEHYRKERFEARLRWFSYGRFIPFYWLKLIRVDAKYANTKSNTPYKKTYNKYILASAMAVFVFPTIGLIAIATSLPPVLITIAFVLALLAIWYVVIYRTSAHRNDP